MTWCYRLAALAVAVALAGCAASAFDGEGSQSGTGGEGASDGAVVTFSDASPLSVAPGQEIVLSVRTDAPGTDVSFLLLGDSLDASLDRAASLTDDLGDADVRLLAPSKASSFKVRASVGDATGQDKSIPSGFAELTVEVSELGIGTLRITPVYDGHRKVETWHAAVLSQARCEDFAPPEDPEDAEVVEGARDEVLVLDDAIVGPTLAVLVRSESKVWGCAETSLTHAGEIKEIAVPVLDRPVDLSSAALDLVLLLQDPSEDVEDVLVGADDLLLEAAFPEADPPEAVLLDAIRGRIPDEVWSAFDAARDGAALDYAVAADLESRQIEPRLMLEEMLRAGRPLGATFLTGRISSAEADATHALLRVETFGGVDGELAGVPAQHLLSFAANPGDTVVIGAESGILFFPTRLVGALAQKVALADAPEGTAFAATLAEAVGCSDVAAVIGPLGDCDTACVEASCRLALGDLWNRGFDASAETADLGVFTVVLSGQGVVDGDAALIALAPDEENTWVGELRAGSRVASIRGTALAFAAEEEGSGGADPTGAGGGSDVGAGQGGASGDGGDGGQGGYAGSDEGGATGGQGDGDGGGDG